MPREHITIRPATAEDAAALGRLFDAVGFGRPPDEIGRALQKQMPSENDRIWVAEPSARNELAGALTAHWYHVLHRPRPVGRITLLVVASEWRRCGVGRLLVNAFEQQMSRVGCGVLEVVSNHRYADAHAFYEHLGYRRSGLKFKKELPGG